ncbi:MAG: hypothetical protein LUD44_00140 [Firmicutes bacterium]|nr:hypothetical protein [Bacillota bacterium]
MSITIALAAYRFVNGDTAFNISQIERALQAAHGRADIVCFGETFLQGFDALNFNYPHDLNVGIARDDDIFLKICAMTRRYGVDLCLGYVECDGDDLYSSCVVIADGAICHNYRRISSGWKDTAIADEHYREGNVSEDFIYKGQKFRIALCGDMWECPERFQTDGILLWSIYVTFSAAEWKSCEEEYAERSNLAAKKALLVNSISENPDAVGGAFLFENGKIADRVPYGAEDILYVAV